MAESQPWRNPRPAPHLPEIQARLRPPRVPAWLRAWWPVVLWACFIFTMSTDTFSSEHTRWVFEPILRPTNFSSSITSSARARTSQNILFLVCCFIAACAATGKAGAGRGASRHSSAPRDIPFWMKSTRPSSPAVPPRHTIPCSTPSAPLRHLLGCGCGSAGDIPKAKQQYRQVTSLPFDSRFAGRQRT